MRRLLVDAVLFFLSGPQYYYSIKDISVGGMCICYGHAQSCPLDLVTKVLPHTCGHTCA